MARCVSYPSLGDARLEAYRNLKRTNLTRWSGRFIAEGEKVVERLLDSSFEAESVLISNRRTELLDRLPPDATVFVLPQSECEQLTGYEFHQGVLACGVRRSPPSLPEVLPPSGRATIVVAPRATDPDNLGSLLRLAAAFGVDAVVLGHGSADPFSRRTLRISMGAAFAVPIIESAGVLATLDMLRSLHVQCVATVLDRHAESLTSAQRPDRLALLMGNEADGLARQEIAACDLAVTIPMDVGADSLNVSAAAAICLYHFMRVL